MTTPTLKQREDRLREALDETAFLERAQVFSNLKVLHDEAKTLLRLMEGMPEKSIPDIELFGVEEFSDGFNACCAEVLKIIEGDK